MNRFFAVTTILVGLAGCVSHNWTPGPDARGTFEEQSAACRMLARNGQTGVVAFGRPAFVAGAIIGNTIGNAVRANATFNDCLEAAGWEVAQ